MISTFWIDILPQEYDTTIFWDDKDLAELRGTNLYRSKFTSAYRLFDVNNRL